MLGLYWGYIGIMENKMETTIEGLGFRVVVPLKEMEYGFGWNLKKITPYTPHSIYVRGTIRACKPCVGSKGTTNFGSFLAETVSGLRLPPSPQDLEGQGELKK